MPKIKKEVDEVKKATQAKIKADKAAAEAAANKLTAESNRLLKKGFILKNIYGEDVDPEKYFYSDGSEVEKNRGTFIPPYFNAMCGLPVDREDLLEVFENIFKNHTKDFLFYKTKNKEVYLVIVPLANSQVGKTNDSVSGDFQRHAVSFITEGSANATTLKMKLKKVASYLKKADEQI